jgi:hypothetical protein
VLEPRRRGGGSADDDDGGDEGSKSLSLLESFASPELRRRRFREDLAFAVGSSS